MKLFCFFLLVPFITLAATPPDFATLRKNAEASAARNGVEAIFDQPYAGNDNPKQRVALLGGTYEEKHAEAVAASPLTYFTPDDPPFLNIQGTKDTRVAYANAEAIHAALQKAGVPSLLVPITGGGHGSVSNLEALHRTEQFIAKYLRGIPEEISTEPIPFEEKPTPAAK